MGGAEATRVRRHTGQSTLAVAIAALLLGAGAGVAAASAVKPRAYDSPEAAVQALVDAVRARNVTVLIGILGSGSRPLISSGDEVADRSVDARFISAYDEAHELVKQGHDRLILQVGKDGWPMPIPLVKDGAGWHFDVAAGQQEVLNRRIGRNELSAIQVCLAYVDAQREYWQRNPEGDSLLHYARRIGSTTGKRDGLYWPVKAGEVASPLGELVVQAQREGYRRAAGTPTPYHGYYYRVLSSQGPAAPGGAYDYLVRGQMVGGFALVAYPAQWAVSGVMTFLVNHDGIVYEKNLGPDTAAVAGAMRQFNPDASWKKV